MLAVKKKRHAYVTFSWELTFSVPDLADGNAVRCGAMQKESLEISEQLQDLAEVFSEELSYQIISRRNFVPPSHFIDVNHPIIDYSPSEVSDQTE